MPISKHFRLPDAGNWETPPEVEPYTPMDTSAAITQESDADALDKQALAEYMRRWEARQSKAGDPTADAYKQRAAERAGTAEMVRGANLLANIQGTPTPFSLDESLKASEQQDAAEQASFLRRQQEADKALPAALQVSQHLEEAPVRRAKSEFELQGLQEAQEDAAAMRNPSSSISVAYRALAKELSPSLASSMGDKVSAAQLEKALPVLKSIYSARKAAEKPQRQHVRQIRTGVDAEGTPVFMQYDPNDGSLTPISGVKAGYSPEERALAGKRGTAKAEAEAETAKGIAKAASLEEFEKNAKALYKKSKFAGPVAGQVGKAAIAAGFSPDEATTELHISLTKALNDYIKDTTGAAVGVKEEARLKSVMPQITDSEDVFNLKLKQAREVAERIVRERQGVAEELPGGAPKAQTTPRKRMKAADLPEVK